MERIALITESSAHKDIPMKAFNFYHSPRNGRDITPIHRSYLEGNDDLEILRAYNAEIQGLYNYFKLANNASSLNSFYYYMRFSMYKTLAHKHKTTMSQIIRKYSVGGNFVVKYLTAKGEKVAYLYNDGFRKDRTAIDNHKVDELPNAMQFSVQKQPHNKTAC